MIELKGKLVEWGSMLDALRWPGFPCNIFKSESKFIWKESRAAFCHTYLSESSFSDSTAI